MQEVFWDAGKTSELIQASSPFRLALYVYEYLLHIGAQKSAQTFLSEVRMGAGMGEGQGGREVGSCGGRSNTWHLFGSSFILALLHVQFSASFLKSKAC